MIDMHEKRKYLLGAPGSRSFFGREPGTTTTTEQQRPGDPEFLPVPAFASFNPDAGG